MSAGTLVPFLLQPCKPGDTWDIKLQCDVKTHPTLGPLFGSFKVQLDLFEAPLRLYHAALLQNTQNIGLQMNQVLLPGMISSGIAVGNALTDSQNPDNQQINPSALLAYLGVRGWGKNYISGTPTRTLNATPLIAYWEIYKNYYSNKQELLGAQITGKVATTQLMTAMTVNGITIPKGGTYPIVTTLG